MTAGFTMLGASFTLVICLMLVLWVIYFFQRNAGIVDIGFGIGFILTAWSYFFLGTGDFFKMLVMAAMVTIWAGRLTGYIYMRFRPEVEDPRYSSLIDKRGGTSPNLFVLMLFVFQGVLVVILSLPFFLVGIGSHPEWSYWEFLGIAVWLIGVLGEGTADAQLAAFVKDPANKGKVCQKGLWRFSRHPNYFFEVVVWIGFYLFALPSDGGSLAIISPILMLLLLLRISGVPFAEEQSLKSKGDAYKEYQETTSVFIPWFPKK